MEKLLTAACSEPGRSKPTLALVGATMDDSMVESATQMVSVGRRPFGTLSVCQQGAAVTEMHCLCTSRDG